MIVDQKTLNYAQETPSIYQEVWRQAKCAIERVRLALRNGVAKQLDFDQTLACLQRLPIALDKFALVTRRFHNAESYYGEGEMGAAVFELNLLHAAIRRDAECAKIRPLATVKSHY